MNLIIQPALLQYQNRGEVKERILVFIHNEISKQVVYYINNTIFPISYNVNRNLENFLKVENINYRYISTDYMLINIDNSKDLIVRYKGNILENNIFCNFINTYSVSYANYFYTHNFIYAIEVPKLEPVKITCKEENLRKIYEDISPYVNTNYLVNFSMENIFYMKTIDKYVIFGIDEGIAKIPTIRFNFLNLLEGKIPYIYNGNEITKENFLIINGGF